MVDDLTRPIIGIENRTPLEVFEIMADRIRRALSQAGAGGGVVVRPLEWRESAVYEWKDLNPSFGRLVVALAETKIGTYGIAKGVQDRFEVWLGDRQIPGSYLTKDEARAAAQADYAALILAALVPSPSAGEPFGWVVGSVFFNEDPGALLGKQTVFATPPAPPVPTASVEAVARALCVEDGYDPDEPVIGGQSTAFQDFGQRWQANERSENTLGGRNYVREARAVLASLTPAPTQGVVIDLDKADWDAIVQAATESSWMPPEYMRNHWVSDLCLFLREGPDAFATPSSPVSAPSPAGGTGEPVGWAAVYDGDPKMFRRSRDELVASAEPYQAIHPVYFGPAWRYQED